LAINLVLQQDLLIINPQNEGLKNKLIILGLSYSKRASPEIFILLCGTDLKFVNRKGGDNVVVNTEELAIILLILLVLKNN